MCVVRLMVEQTDAVSIILLGMLAHSARGGVAHTLHPVSDECWMMHQDSQYARPECNRFDVSRYY